MFFLLRHSYYLLYISKFENITEIFYRHFNIVNYFKNAIKGKHIDYRLVQQLLLIK